MTKAIYYRPKVFCDNCGLHRKIAIDRGKTITFTECPFCGCRTLKASSLLARKERE